MNDGEEAQPLPSFSSIIDTVARDEDATVKVAPTDDSIDNTTEASDRDAKKKTTPPPTTSLRSIDEKKTLVRDYEKLAEEIAEYVSMRALLEVFSGACLDTHPSDRSEIIHCPTPSPPAKELSKINTTEASDRNANKSTLPPTTSLRSIVKTILKNTLVRLYMAPAKLRIDEIKYLKNILVRAIKELNEEKNLDDDEYKMKYKKFENMLVHVASQEKMAEDLAEYGELFSGGHLDANPYEVSVRDLGIPEMKHRQTPSSPAKELSKIKPTLNQQK